MNLLRDLIDLIIPPLCCVCKRRLKNDEKILCTDCYSRIRLITPPYCERCGRPLPNLDINVCNTCIVEKHPFSYVRAVSPYEGIIEGLIILLKYNGKRQTSKILGGLMSKVVKMEETYRNCELIVPVPLHTTRKRERGYNQAELLGNELSSELNIPIIPDALIRTRATPSQTKLPTEHRKKNVLGAFSINKRRQELFRGKTVLLVDDVFTTGATLNECTKTLIKGKTTDVLGIVCAVAGWELAIKTSDKRP
ncbi:ComF family protein [candidate division WOR-3 bacterium]|nr:ComF family protein [candidate division WOR-3 bacterium]